MALQASLHRIFLCRPSWPSVLDWRLLLSKGNVKQVCNASPLVTLYSKSTQVLSVSPKNMFSTYFNTALGERQQGKASQYHAIFPILPTLKGAVNFSAQCRLLPSISALCLSDQAQDLVPNQLYQRLFADTGKLVQLSRMPPSDSDPKERSQSPEEILALDSIPMKYRVPVVDAVLCSYLDARLETRPAAPVNPTHEIQELPMLRDDEEEILRRRTADRLRVVLGRFIDPQNKIIIDEGFIARIYRQSHGQSQAENWHQRRSNEWESAVTIGTPNWHPATRDDISAIAEPYKDFTPHDDTRETQLREATTFEVLYATRGLRKDFPEGVEARSRELMKRMGYVGDPAYSGKSRFIFKGLIDHPEQLSTEEPEHETDMRFAFTRSC